MAICARGTISSTGMRRHVRDTSNEDIQCYLPKTCCSAAEARGFTWLIVVHAIDFGRLGRLLEWESLQGGGRGDSRDAHG